MDGAIDPADELRDAQRRHRRRMLVVVGAVAVVAGAFAVLVAMCTGGGRPSRTTRFHGPAHQIEMATLSRPAVAVLWAFGVPLVHVGGPWALARVGERHGWLDAVPATWNIAGLVPALVGAALLAWSVVWHMRNAPERSKISTQVSYLVERGPYAYSRNPMYVAELVLWLGWAVFYGSIAVAAGMFVLWYGMMIAVRWEEHSLGQHFGESYEAYRRRVPRWFGVTRAT